jgi:Fur family transcriptional regulator, ferric uptake regulator
MVRSTAGTFGFALDTLTETEYHSGTMTDTPTELALDRAGYRLTEPRRAVARLIADQSGHFAAADLVQEARVRRLGIGRATIFRTLDVLLELGLVERLDLPSGEHAYVGCAASHHHHVVCSSCGRTVEIEDAGLRTLVREVARRTGFRVDDHRLEFFGLCAECQPVGAA